MATPKETAPATTPRPLTLQQKFVELRKAIPEITQKKHSDGVKYKFAKIFDVYELLTPAMNDHGVNFDIVAEEATRHAENGDPLYYHSFQQQTQKGPRTVWVYEADLTLRWTNAEIPEDELEVTLHAIGTNDGGPDKAKGSAWTYCLKYYFFEKFGIDQGDDDPDMADHSNETGQNQPSGGRNRATGAPNGSRQGNARPAAQGAGNQATGGQKPLSEAQLSRMYKKGEAVGYDQAKLNDWIAKATNQTDPHKLTREQYDKICEKLDKAAEEMNGGTQA